jgi:small-conductance mechanosensitive channel
MAEAKQEISAAEAAKRASASLGKAILYIVLYVVVSALVKYLITEILVKIYAEITAYEVYIQILLAFAFGYLIISQFAWFFYWTTRPKYGHPTAAAIRNVIRIIGIGALAAAIAGGVAGGAAGVALGGFLGMVVGFASQQVLGQAIAGLFLLIARPFRVGDAVIIAGEDGTVEDVSTLFTIVRKADGITVLIPNNAIIGGKIYLKPKR